MTEHLQLRLDDKWVESKTEGYPEIAREGARWLAAYVRERCSRQIAILVKKAESLKFETDYSYWHKVLTGKYFGPDPAKPGKIIGSVENFLKMVDALRTLAKREGQAGRTPFIETTTWTMISDFVDVIRQPFWVNKFGGIVGYTGTQKSACLKEYRNRNNHGKVVHIEAPERPRMGQFLTDLAVAYGESATKTGEKKISAITQAVNDMKCIIVDNVQRLYTARKGGDQPIFNFLQKLQDDTDCTVILSWTPTFTQTLTSGLDRGYFEQFIGRMGGMESVLELPPYAPREDVVIIAEAYGLKPDETEVEYLESVARRPGRIRALFGALQKGKSEALGNEEVFAVSHVKAVVGAAAAGGKGGGR